MNKILLCGAMGRMGREVANAAGEYGFEIAAGIDSFAGKAGFPLYAGFTDAIREEADVIIDLYTHDDEAYRLSNLEGIVKLEKMGEIRL